MVEVWAVVAVDSSWDHFPPKKCQSIFKSKNESFSFSFQGLLVHLGIVILIFISIYRDKPSIKYKCSRTQKLFKVSDLQNFLRQNHFNPLSTRTP